MIQPLSLKHKIFLSFFGFFCSQSFATKPTQSDTLTLSGPKSSAKGSASVATPASYDNLILNPAAAAIPKQYNVGVGYLSTGKTMLASIVDTKSSQLGGGVYYLRRDSKKSAIQDEAAGDFQRVESRVGLSLFAKVSEEVSFGGGAKYVNINTYQNPSLQNATVWNGDLGFYYQAAPSTRLGIGVTNFLDDENDYLPTSVQLGADYLLNESIIFSALLMRYEKLDSASKFRRPSDSLFVYAIGAEYLYKSLSLKAGYRENSPWSQKLLSAGMGYSADKFSADYAATFVTQGSGETKHDFSLGLLF
ncbi:MAG: hypothetical protein KA116_06710 [Proteobacteria bacterium]|nr:hypothetical protein [Pseudomonadota bacterium]